MAMRRILRRFLTWLLVGAVGAIIVALFAEWLIEVARDKGYYDNAGRNWDSLVSAVLAFATSTVPLTGIALLAGLVGGMWLDQLLLRRERDVPTPLSSDAKQQEELGALLTEAYKSLGMAIGTRSALQFQMTISTIEPLFLQMNRLKDIASPDLRGGGEEAGCLRAFQFLNYVAPTLRLLDFDATRDRASEIVPTLNRMTVEELRDRIGTNHTSIAGY